MKKQTIFQCSRAALGVAASALAMMAAAPVAMAQTAGREASVQQVELSAGPLGRSILAISDAFDVDILAPNSLVSGKTAPAVSGAMSADDALMRVLQGSGLKATLAEDGAFVIGLEAARAEPPRARYAAADLSGPLAADAIVVVGRGQAATLRDTPQSVRVFDAEFFADVAAVDISDIVRFAPSASTQYGEVGFLADAYFARGFAITQVINSARLNSSNFPLDAAVMERVEVLMGPASVLYGSMQPGAVVNIVTKTPLDETHLDIGVELGSFDHQRYTLDVGGPLGDGVRARLNVAYQDRETFLDFWEEKKLILSPALEWDIGADTTLNLLGVYSELDQPAGAYLGTPAAGLLTENPNGDYPRSFNVQSPDEQGVGRQRHSANIEATLNHRFTDYLTGRLVLSYTSTERDDQTIIGSLQDDFRTVNRINVGNVSDGDDYAAYVDLTGEFTTGPIRHQISVGGEYFRTKLDNLQTRFVVDPLDLFNPAYTAVLDPANQIRNRPSELDDETVGVFIQDRMSIGDRVHLIAGVRYAEITSENTGARTSQSETPTTFGFVVDVTDSISLFGNRSESFLPRSGTTANNAVFDPETSTQYEGGAKFQIAGLTGALSYFHIEKPDVLTPDLDNPGFQLPLGSVASQGVEVSIGGEIYPDLEIYAAYAYMDTEVGSNDPGLDGNVLQYAPENTFAFTGRYDVTSGPLNGLGLTAAVQYADDRFIDAANTLVGPSFVRVDLGADYAVSEHVELGFLVDNLTDADIFTGIGSNFIDLNPPRTFFGRVRISL